MCLVFVVSCRCGCCWFSSWVVIWIVCCCIVICVVVWNCMGCWFIWVLVGVIVMVSCWLCWVKGCVWVWIWSFCVCVCVCVRLLSVFFIWLRWCGCWVWRKMFVCCGFFVCGVLRKLFLRCRGRVFYLVCIVCSWFWMLMVFCIWFGVILSLVILCVGIFMNGRLLLIFVWCWCFMCCEVCGDVG